MTLRCGAFYTFSSKRLSNAPLCPGREGGGGGGEFWGLYWLVHYFGINFTFLFSGIAGHLFLEDMTWINEILFYIYEDPSTFWHLTYLNARIQEIRTGILKKSGIQNNVTFDKSGTLEQTFKKTEILLEHWAAFS